MKRFLSTGLASIALAMSSPMVLATPPACGRYVDADSGARLEIDDPVRARLLREGSAPASQHYRVTGTRLRLFDTDQATPRTSR